MFSGLDIRSIGVQSVQYLDKVSPPHDYSIPIYLADRARDRSNPAGLQWQLIVESTQIKSEYPGLATANLIKLGHEHYNQPLEISKPPLSTPINYCYCCDQNQTESYLYL